MPTSEHVDIAAPASMPTTSTRTAIAPVDCGTPSAVRLILDLSHYLCHVHLSTVQALGTGAMPVQALRALHDLFTRLVVPGTPAGAMICVAEHPDWTPPLHGEHLREAYASQIETALELARVLGWRTLVAGQSGAMAIIGGLVAAPEAPATPTVVVGTRKRLAAHVSPTVTWHDPLAGRSYDPTGVLERFGVPPASVLDYLVLVGDDTDAITGVPGLGPKRARILLRESAGLEALAQPQDSIGADMRALLAPYLDTVLAQRRRLAAVARVAVPHGDASIPVADMAPAAFLLRHGLQPAPAPDIKHGQIDVVDTEQELERLRQMLAGRREGPVAIAYHRSPGAPRTARLTAIAVCTEPGRCAYLRLAEPTATGAFTPELVFDRLRSWLEDARAPKVIHDTRTAAHLLANAGIRLRGVVDDPMLQSYALESHTAHDLATLAQRHLRRDLPAADKAERSAGDLVLAADLTGQLAAALNRRLDTQPRVAELYRHIELPVSSILLDIERLGMCIDLVRLRDLAREFAHAMRERGARAAAGERSPSDPALGSAQPGRAQSTHAPATERDRGGADGAAQELRMLLDRYIHPLPRHVDAGTGRIHSMLGQVRARTGRLTSAEPPLHSIPIRTANGARVREAFVAAPVHVLVSADYSQIELRILADLSCDPGLCTAFQTGQDVHCATAAELFGITPEAVTADQRRFAKHVNFGLIYGMTAPVLAERAGIARAEARAFIARYFRRFPGVAEFLAETRRRARAQGYVDTVFGRRIWIPDIAARSFAARAHAQRQATNAPMQGTAADLIKLAMIAVSTWITEHGRRSRLVMQIHDELLLEVPLPELSDVTKMLPVLMTAASPLRVPLVVDVGVGDDWRACSRHEPGQDADGGAKVRPQQMPHEVDGAAASGLHARVEEL